MTGMGELYQRELSGPLLDAYWLCLRDWSLADFEAAAAQLMRTSEFMPRPSAFAELRKCGRATPGEEWIKVRAHMRQYNCFDAKPPTYDAIAARVVQALGGIYEIAQTPSDKMHFVEKRFCEHYEAMRDAEEIREALPQIACSDSTRLSGPQSVQQLLGKLQ